SSVYMQVSRQGEHSLRGRIGRARLVCASASAMTSSAPVPTGVHRYPCPSELVLVLDTGATAASGLARLHRLIIVVLVWTLRLDDRDFAFQPGQAILDLVVET